MFRSALLLTTFAAGLSAGAGSSLAQTNEDAATDAWANPDGPNAEIKPEGPSASFAILNISTEDTVSGLFKLTVDTPIHDKFGASFDWIAGVGDDEPIFGGAGRVYWRDPDVGMLGVYGVGTHAEMLGHKFDVFGVGAEGALYFDRFELEGAAGFTTGDGVPDDFVGVASAAYYPLEDIRLSAGTRYFAEKFHGAVDVEYALRDYGTSFYSGGMLGEDEDWQVLAGLKVQLGGGDGHSGGGGASSRGAGITGLAVSIASEAATKLTEAAAKTAGEVIDQGAGSIPTLPPVVGGGAAGGGTGGGTTTGGAGTGGTGGGTTTGGAGTGGTGSGTTIGGAGTGGTGGGTTTGGAGTGGTGGVIDVYCVNGLPPQASGNANGKALGRCKNL